MEQPAVVHIEVITLEETFGLRQLVLRDPLGIVGARVDQDELPGAVHLGARTDNGRLAGCVSAFPRPAPGGAGRRPWQFRMMAVHPEAQGIGIGRRLLADLFDRLRSVGADVVWANARETAWAFYEHMGMAVAGETFIESTTGLPHHVVQIDLAAPTSGTPRR